MYRYYRVSKTTGRVLDMTPDEERDEEMVDLLEVLQYVQGVVCWREAV